MKIIITESQLNYLMESSDNDAITAMEEIKLNIHKLLSYYEKTKDGEYIDIKTKTSVDLKPTGGYLKTKIESILFGVKQEGKPANIISKVNDIKNQITTGKFGEFFGDYDLITILPQKFDFYTQKKCSEMNPKSPGCKA